MNLRNFNILLLFISSVSFCMDEPKGTPKKSCALDIPRQASEESDSSPKAPSAYCDYPGGPYRSLEDDKLFTYPFACIKCQLNPRIEK